MYEYESPIDVFIENVKEAFEDGVYKAVQRAGFSVDKEELTKALAYDRGQFELGYAAGLEAGEQEIVRCKDCENWQREWQLPSGNHYCSAIDRSTDGTFFCADGERRDDEQREDD